MRSTEDDFTKLRHAWQIIQSRIQKNGVDSVPSMPRAKWSEATAADGGVSTVVKCCPSSSSALKPNHRQCLILSDVEDMNAQQIGEVMEMTNGAVRVLLCRARAEMRRLLTAEGLVR